MRRGPWLGAAPQLLLTACAILPQWKRPEPGNKMQKVKMLIFGIFSQMLKRAEYCVRRKILLRIALRFNGRGVIESLKAGARAPAFVLWEISQPSGTAAAPGAR